MTGDPKAQPPGKKAATSSPGNPLDFFFLMWLSPLLKTGYKNPLVEEDLYVMKAKSTAESLTRQIQPFNDQLARYLQQKKAASGDGGADAKGVRPPSLFPVFVRLFLGRWLVGFLMCVIYKIGIVCTPILLRQVILSISGEPAIIANPYGTSVLLFLCVLLSAVIGGAESQIMISIAIDIRTAVTGLIFEKSFKLSPKSSLLFPEGKQLAFVNVDAQQMYQAVMSLDSAITDIFQVAVILYLIWSLIGPSVFISIGIVLGGFVFAGVCAVFISRSQRNMLKHNDSRIHLIREVFLNVRMIKLRGWESIFEGKIDGIRQNMLRALAGFLVSLLAIISVIISVPMLLPAISFIFYSRFGNVLRPENIFPAIALFTMILQPLNDLPQTIGAIVQAQVSWARLSAFFAAEELSDAEIAAKREQLPLVDDEYAVVITDATFKHEDPIPSVPKPDPKAKKSKKGKSKPGNATNEDPVPENVADQSESKVATEPISDEPLATKPIFEGLSLKIKKGQLTAVVGRVGSGKSSLLSALMNQIAKLEGTVAVNGQIAYCSQQPWIRTATLKDNILFESTEQDDERLGKVVVACGLERDLTELPNGILTEIGEKGVNLSGGQNARVALARAVYSNGDIYLLDDPLAALDAHVGKQVFEDCISSRGILADKTRVLVTHQLHLMPHTDNIIVLDDGKVVESGSFSDLMAFEGGYLSKLMGDYQHDPEAYMASVKPKDNKDKKGAKKDDEKGGIITSEEIQKGAVPLKIYWDYFKYGGGFAVFLPYLLFSLMTGAANIGAGLWMNFWTSPTNPLNLRQDQYLLGYIVLQVILTVTLIISSSILAINSRKVHRLLISKLLSFPVGFFDSQPLGRILNRLSKDIEFADQSMWNIVMNAIILSMLVLSGIIVNIYATPWIAAFYAVLSVLVWFIFLYYRASVRQLKRLDSNLRSPLYAFISESFTGSSTIRAFHAEQRVIKKQQVLIDQSNAPFYLNQLCAIWFRVRVSALSSLVILAMAILAIATGISPSLAALGLSYALDIPSQLIGLGQILSLVEQGMNSMERFVHYIEDLPTEAPRRQEHYDPKTNWPTNGEIVINNLSVAYPSRPDHLVLTDISLAIRPGEKLGVVGRTGSGKSTLIQALFRMVEPVKGSIVIDGHDTSNLGLHTLRQNIQIIPQEPVLFTGTIRSNLDIEGTYSDADIWDALEVVGLKDFVTDLPLKIEAPVADGGSNLSVGQRQLLCLARAIICKPKILVLDEASSAVDAEADARIQKSIQDNFSSSTVISIAHRLNTIANFDRILVLNAGKVAELDTPHTLLTRPEGGIFAELAEATGAANADLLRSIAADHAAAQSSSI
ncbi:P-loop containing nucleoside triphosphate hydrolase protein [Polychytrium aggregatum]|uniref:P-loop containing nucleoside triphosphate hydrolase protein n=1 Tax=Polychytrium aggregatum TaxID=110093 RepID=UPI0022FF04B0|nr:P-loop containing nucleoside triphosphate hydrolase protein [Polychytrium aggregatum]KAI9197119.1 P-loop containing nucleoside triphosphate hydrolase protein [Polychytrium aggregatum]